MICPFASIHLLRALLFPSWGLLRANINTDLTLRIITIINTKGKKAREDVLVNKMGRSGCPCTVTEKVSVVFSLLLAILLVNSSTLTQIIYKQQTNPF